MNTAALGETVVLGAVTGMRSMSGLAALTRGRGTVQGLAAAMALGEMLADKTPFVGDRIDPLPLAGRAVMGAVVGGLIAREEHANVAAGSLVGAAAAVLAAHAAYRIRKRLPIPGAVAGLLEDAVVFGVTALVTRRRTG